MLLMNQMKSATVKNKIQHHHHIVLKKEQTKRATKKYHRTSTQSIVEEIQF